MKIELKDGLDPKAYRDRLARGDLITVHEFLKPEAAEELFWALYRQIHWQMIYIEKGENVRVSYEKLPKSNPAEIHAIRQKAFLSAKNCSQYLYYAQSLPDPEAEAGATNLFVQDIAGFLGSKSFLGFMAGVTGDENVTTARTEAQLFQGFCFHSTRTGIDIAKGAVAVFTLDLTKEWFPFWGGYLQFRDQGGNIEKAIFPGFNALHVFPATKPFSIGYVPPFCNGARLSISGLLKRAS